MYGALCCRHLARHFASILLFEQPCKFSTIIIPILQMANLRLRRWRRWEVLRSVWLQTFVLHQYIFFSSLFLFLLPVSWARPNGPTSGSGRRVRQGHSELEPFWVNTIPLHQIPARSHLSHPICCSSLCPHSQPYIQMLVCDSQHQHQSLGRKEGS